MMVREELRRGEEHRAGQTSLTCPDFQTTPEFLDTHRRQSTVNLRLITRADANGQTRLAASLRQVQDSLERIIPALEAIPASEEPGDDQS